MSQAEQIVYSIPRDRLTQLHLQLLYNKLYIDVVAECFGALFTIELTHLVAYRYAQLERMN